MSQEANRWSELVGVSGDAVRMDLHNDNGQVNHLTWKGKSMATDMNLLNKWAGDWIDRIRRRINAGRITGVTLGWLICCIVATIGNDTICRGEPPTEYDPTVAAATQPSTDEEADATQRIQELKLQLDALPIDSPDRMAIASELLTLRRLHQSEAVTETSDTPASHSLPFWMVDRLRTVRLSQEQQAVDGATAQVISLRKDMSSQRNRGKDFRRLQHLKDNLSAAQQELARAERSLQKLFDVIAIRYPTGCRICPACRGKGYRVEETNTPVARWNNGVLSVLSGGSGTIEKKCMSCAGLGVKARDEAYEQMVAVISAEEISERREKMLRNWMQTLDRMTGKGETYPVWNDEEKKLIESIERFSIEQQEQKIREKIASIEAIQDSEIAESIIDDRLWGQPVRNASYLPGAMPPGMLSPGAYSPGAMPPGMMPPGMMPPGANSSGTAGVGSSTDSEDQAT